MKKWIGIAVAIVILVAGYFLVFNRSSLIDTALTQYLEKNTQVETLLVDETDLRIAHTINSFTQEQILSELTIALEGDSETIPMVSDIERGTFKDGGQTFDYGRIVTHVDLSGSTSIAPFNEKDFLNIEHFIDDSGQVRGKYRINEVVYTEEEVAGAVNFDGVDIIVDTNLIKPEDGSLDLAIGRFEFKDSKDRLSMEPINLFASKKRDNCTITVEPIKFTIDNIFVYDGGKGKSEGFCQWDEEIDALVYDLKGESDAIQFQFLEPGFDIAFSSAMVGTKLVHEGEGIVDVALNLDMIPHSNLLQQFSMDIEPTAMRISYAFDNIPYGTLKELGRLTENSDQDELTNTLADAFHNPIKFSAELGLESVDGDLAAHGAFTTSDFARSITQQQFDEILGGLGILKLIDGKIEVVSDNSLLTKSGWASMINIMFGKFVRNDTEQDRSFMDLIISEGEMTINDQRIN